MGGTRLRPGEEKTGVDLGRQICDILVISTTRDFGSTLSTLLPGSGCSPARFMSGVDTTGQTLTRHTFSFMVVGSPLPSSVKAHFTVSAKGSGRAIMLLVMQTRLRTRVCSGITRRNIFILPGPASGPVVVATLD